MKTSFVINTHSFVDLITNSSTELYICDNKKTLECVKEILTVLLDNHNRMMNTSFTFDEVFKEPEISKHSFSYWQVPVALREKYENYSDYGGAYGGRDYNSRNPKIEALEKQERLIPRIPDGLYKTNKDEYERLCVERRKSEDAMWTNFGAQKMKAELGIFLEFLKQNELSLEVQARAAKAIPHIIKSHRNKKGGKYPYPEFEDDSIRKIYNDFSHIHSWGLEIQPKSVMVYSRDDNSIPYELMEALESYLHASRHHLG